MHSRCAQYTGATGHPTALLPELLDSNSAAPCCACAAASCACCGGWGVGKAMRMAESLGMRVSPPGCSESATRPAMRSSWLCAPSCCSMIEELFGRIISNGGIPPPREHRRCPGRVIRSVCWSVELIWSCSGTSPFLFSALPVGNAHAKSNVADRGVPPWQWRPQRRMCPRRKGMPPQRSAPPAAPTAAARRATCQAQSQLLPKNPKGLSCPISRRLACA